MLQRLSTAKGKLPELHWRFGLPSAALFVAFCLSTTSLAAEFYVNNARSSSGDGQSWATAWRNFSNINWSAIRPGDRLNISGGTSGQVYGETLTVGVSGTASQPIVIRRAVDDGHNGSVVIDAQNSRYYGVVVDGRNHVQVSGLNVRNVGDAGVRVRSVTAGVVIENMKVDAGNPNNQHNARGYDVRDSQGVIVRNNAYSTPTWSTAQNDGVYSMNNDNVTFSGNRLIISNSYTGSEQGHNDCIQSYVDKNITIIGNYCEQRNTKTGHSQGIFVQNISGTALVVNNVVVSPNTNSACFSIENMSGFSTAGRMLAYNNSGYGCAYGTMHIVRSPGTIARNNTLMSPKSSSQAMKVVRPEPPAANINNNVLFTPLSSRPVMLEGVGTLTWSQWQARGYERNGLYGSPGYVDAGNGDLSLKANAIAIDKGATIPAVTTDKNGVARPQGAAYDIGAFEHKVTTSTQATSTETTSPETTLDETTLDQTSSVQTSSVTPTVEPDESEDVSQPTSRRPHLKNNKRRW
jgi:hypothetical protein